MVIYITAVWVGLDIFLAALIGAEKYMTLSAYAAYKQSKFFCALIDTVLQEEYHCEMALANWSRRHAN